MKYGVIKHLGIEAYVAGLICRQQAVSLDGTIYLASLFGTAAAIESVSSAILASYKVFITWEEDGKTRELRVYRPNHPMVSDFRQKYEGGVVTKILYTPRVLSQRNSFVVIAGPDMPTVKKRAFLRLDQITTVPLKESWIDYLWEGILQPEKLISWGSREVTEAWMIYIPSDDELQEHVIEGIRNQYLT